MRYKKRLPSLKNVRFWVLVFVLYLVNVIINAQLEHFWPNITQWIRTPLFFLSVFIVGELWVRKYWPNMRRYSSEISDINTALTVLLLFFSAAIVVSEMIWQVHISAGAVALITYLVYLLVDASYQW